MAFYECVIITRPELSTSQVEGTVENLKNILSSTKSEVKKTEYWGLRSLAYKIKKNKKGHYSMIIISSEPTAIFELERQMRINEDILRFLTIKIDEVDLSPSILNQTSSDKEVFTKNDENLKSKDSTVNKDDGVNQ